MPLFVLFVKSFLVAASSPCNPRGFLFLARALAPAPTGLASASCKAEQVNWVNCNAIDGYRIGSFWQLGCMRVRSAHNLASFLGCNILN
jgi:hypothetical protein